MSEVVADATEPSTLHRATRRVRSLGPITHGAGTPQSLDVGDEHLGVVLDLLVDGHPLVVHVEARLVVPFEQHQQLERQPLLQVHQLSCVTRRVLAVGLVQLDPDGVPDVERHHAVGAELPQSVGLRQDLVGEP